MYAVMALTVLAAVLRIVLGQQSLFADELSTFWIVSQHGLGDVVSIVHTNAEITPPLFFVLSWLGAQVSHAPEWIRSPSLVAGVATVPLVWALGRRTVGKHAALVAAALVTLSPFMQYYGSEARGYALAMALVVLSTLAMVLAVDRRSAPWWVVYAVASAGAMYSHYTVAFALLAQLGWVLWAHPEARRAALLANVGAAVLFLPWVSGLRNDLNSPTQDILSALSPFTPHEVAVALGHWAVGYPYGRLPLRELPGVPGLILIGLGLLTGVAGLVLRRVPLRVERRTALIVLLALSLPVGEALASAVGTNVFGVRNLAASWPALALALGALLTAGRSPLRVVAPALVLLGFAFATVEMLRPRTQRPPYQDGAKYVRDHARPGDVVVDQTGSLSPGPVTGLDAALPGVPTIRAEAPAERDHPYAVADRRVPTPEAVRQAVRVAHGHRIYVVGNELPSRFPQPPGLRERRRPRVPAPYREVAAESWPGSISDVTVRVFARP